MLNSLISYLLSFRMRKAILRTILISSLFSFTINMMFGAQLVLQFNDGDQTNNSDFLTASATMALAIVPVILSLHHILR